MDMNARQPLAAPANPGASSAAVIYDNGFIPAGYEEMKVTPQKRLILALFTNVADAVLRVEWAAPGSTNLRLVQADTAIAASLFFERNILLQPGRLKVSIVTVTAPTTWEVAVELVDDQSLAQ